MSPIPQVPFSSSLLNALLVIPAAAMLMAAAILPARVAALVRRGGGRIRCGSHGVFAVVGDGGWRVGRRKSIVAGMAAACTSTSTGGGGGGGCGGSGNMLGTFSHGFGKGVVMEMGNGLDGGRVGRSVRVCGGSSCVLGRLASLALTRCVGVCMCVCVCVCVCSFSLPCSKLDIFSLFLQECEGWRERRGRSGGKADKGLANKKRKMALRSQLL